ncbi:MAG TPA: hypothetical protein VMJ10_30020 [Kofleriaceae bacterium]|nr:hypothetical protein [Kofleriaceae bacterium]
MKLSFILIGLAVVVSCKKSAEVPPQPFAGKLTPATVEAAKGTVHPMQAWDEAFAALQTKLGTPTHVEDKGKATRFSWAAKDGEHCAYITVERMDGTEHGTPGLVVGEIKQASGDAVGSSCTELLASR